VRWVAVWLLLAAVDGAVTLGLRLAHGAPFLPSSADLLQLALVPPLQLALLALVTAARRHAALPRNRSETNR
jgi:hypothetical protein